MFLVCLDTASSSGIRHNSSDSGGTLPSWVGNPSYVNEAVVNSSEWVDDHATAGVFAIVYHHECCVDASLTLGLVIDGELVHFLCEAAAENLQVR